MWAVNPWFFFLFLFSFVQYFLLCTVLSTVVDNSERITAVVTGTVTIQVVTMNLKTLHLVLLAVSVNLSFVLMSFSCGAPCRSVFTKRGGLQRHRNECPIYRTTQALQLEHRRTREKNRQLRDKDSGTLDAQLERTAPKVWSWQ